MDDGSKFQNGVELHSNGTITGMEGGFGEWSYTRNSQAQSRAFELCLKPVLEQAISQLKFLNSDNGFLRVVKVADLGCSVGDNTLRYADLISKCIQINKQYSNGSLDIEYVFSDLPTNDFNTLFLQLENWTQQDHARGKLYPAAVPGSFFKQLFPDESLHVVISTWALHYLTQVPEAVTDKASAAYGKQQVHIPRGSPPAVVKAYAERSKQDLLQFFSCRAREVVSGGLVVLYFFGRADEEHPDNQWGQHLEGGTVFGTILEETWKTLALEGTISEEMWNSFNLPVYAPSIAEVKAAVNATDAFRIEKLQVDELACFTPELEKQLLDDPEAYGRFHTGMVAAILRTSVTDHIGPENADKFFQRMTQLATDAVRHKRITKINAQCMLVVLTRK